ncbi:hypothetical protein HY947_02995 [Candidatus Gottesmanbacteria bacterium]|nr:hypothetical protein [Candidatus Gottesmanbacteria bacterium]
MRITDYCRHFLTPHHSNNFKPKALHAKYLFVYALLFVAFYFFIDSFHHAFPNILGYATDIYVQSLLDDTNIERGKIGLATVVLNEKLSVAAYKKAQDMFANNYWAHVSPKGVTPWDFIVAQGYQYTVAGENLAKNFTTSKNVVDAWMASPTHKANIVKSAYREVGFAVVNGILNGEETTLVVQMFGASSSQMADLVKKQPPIIVDSSGASIKGEATSLPNDALRVFYSATNKPLVNIPTLTRSFSLVVVSGFILLLIIDAWIISRKKIVRISGHNVAHILFFVMLAVVFAKILPGGIL